MAEKKQKIAMLGHKRIPSREGGVEIVVEELAVRMAAMGHEVTAYNRRGHHVSGAEFDAQELRAYRGVRLKSVPTLDAKGLAAVSASFFASLAAALGPYDVVHYHAEGPCAFLWLPRLFGKRCIATVHGLDHQRAKWGKFAAWYIRTGEQCAARWAHEIIVLSEGVQQYFLDTYGRRTVFIPNGVSRPKHRPAEEITRAYGLEKGEYILYLSRLVPEKGAAYLIDAFRALDTRKKLVIAGGASDSADYAEALRHRAGEDPRILFTGFVQGRVLEELYSNAYVYVLPSDLEGMPLSLLEAMSYGNCCLTSDIPECARVVEDHGVTFPRGDIQALGAKLALLCGDGALVRTYQENAADFICGKYNWDAVAQMTAALYGERNEGTADQ